MTDKVGIVRDKKGLTEAHKIISELNKEITGKK